MNVKQTGIAAALFCALGFSACGKAENPNDYPIGHWLNDGEDCVRASAAAILKAGLPFPNFGWEEVAGAASGAPPRRRITTVDMWLGPTRFVIPAKYAYSYSYCVTNAVVRLNGHSEDIDQGARSVHNLTDVAAS